MVYTCGIDRMMQQKVAQMAKYCLCKKRWKWSNLREMIKLYMGRMRNSAIEEWTTALAQNKTTEDMYKYNALCILTKFGQDKFSCSLSNSNGERTFKTFLCRGNSL